MSKILTTLFAGLFAASMSVGAFAADAAKPVDQTAPTADAATAKEKPTMPAAKKHMMRKHVMHKHVTKAQKTEKAEDKTEKATAPAAK